jgi:hypothetical protein
MRLSRRKVSGLRALALVSLVVAVITGGVSTIRTAAQAQAQAPANPLVQLILVDVKPDAWEEYVALQKAETIPALQKAGIASRSAWRAASIGRMFRVAYLYPMTTFGQFDEKGPMIRALGEDGAKAYNARLRKLLDGVQYQVLRRRDDLSFGLDGGPQKLGVLAHVHTVPGRQSEYDSLLKDQWTPALKKAGVALYAVHEVVMGGAMGEYYTFTPITNYAMLDAGHPIMKSLGPAEFQALSSKMGGTLQDVTREVIKLDDDLSFSAKTTTTK